MQKKVIPCKECCGTGVQNWAENEDKVKIGQIWKSNKEPLVSVLRPNCYMFIAAADFGWWYVIVFNKWGVEADDQNSEWGGSSFHMLGTNEILENAVLHSHIDKAIFPKGE